MLKERLSKYTTSGKIGFSFVVFSVVLINIFTFNPGADIEDIKAKNSFELTICSLPLQNCDVTNYIESGDANMLVFVCPSNNLIKQSNENAKLFVNGASAFTACIDDATESHNTHVFKCGISSLSVLN